ncbi:MAG: response regulator [Hyphomonadaceae bacterium]
MDQIVHTRAALALVDADRALRHALSFSFATEGIDVDAFGDARSVLGAVRETPWPCLVADYALPDMNGLELFERLRATGRVAHAILTATNPSRSLLSRAEAARVDLIEKPLLSDQLLRRVRGVLM